MNENDLELVEGLVKSPIFAALVRVLDAQKAAVIEMLTQEKDPMEMKVLQGRIQGINVLKNVPVILTQQREAKKAKATKAQ